MSTKETKFSGKKKVAVIVAHPDDETLWAGGVILGNPDWDVFIISLCRVNDKDRSQKFYEVLNEIHATGIMGNLNDGPKQKSLSDKVIEQWILKLIPCKSFDLIITHNPLGEYTRHLRHEEVGKSVINLWSKGKISTGTLWIFAFEDDNKSYLPQPIKNADFFLELSKELWQKKYDIVTKTYGFKPESWEAKVTPKGEAFWQFTNGVKAKQWMQNLNLN